MCCKIKKSLYGLKQESRQGYVKISQALFSRWYTHSDSDYSLFFKMTVTSLVFVVVYINDIVLTGNDVRKINSLRCFLHDNFKIKDLGNLH